MKPLSLCVALGLTLCVSVVFAQNKVLAIETPKNTKPTFWDGRIYLKIKPSHHTTPLSMAQLNEPNKVYSSLLHELKQAQVVSISRPFLALKTLDWSAVYDIQLGEKNATSAFIKAVAALDCVEYVEPVPIMRHQYTPNDPQHVNQYHLTKIKAYNAWNTHRGGGAVVAIVDDAVRLTHEDLASNIWVNPNEIPNNGIDDDNNGYVDDINGYDVASNDNDPSPGTTVSNTNFTHGTHCAGIAGAVSDNNLGIASIGFNNKIMAVKTTNIGDGSLSHPFEGVVYAIAAGAQVISMSWGGGFSQTGQSLFNTANTNGIVCIAAAGNDNTDEMFYPAAYNHVISVAATDQNDTKAGFSNYGTWVDVSAPGVAILSTLAGSDQAYGSLSGTSMACPLVAGLAGLIRSRNPNFTPTQVENCIKAFADNIDAQNPSFLSQLGTGRISAEAAIQCSGTCSSPIGISPITITNFNTTTIEAGNTIQFAANATNATQFAWTLGGQIAPFSTHANSASRTFNTQGNYRIFYTASNADPLCREQSYLDITIQCPIDVNFSAPTSIIVGTPLSISNTSNNASGISYQWFLDGNAVNTPPSSLPNTGVYLLELRATNGICTVSKQQTIKVFELNSLSYTSTAVTAINQFVPLTDGGQLVLSTNQIIKLSKTGTKRWVKWINGTQSPFPHWKSMGVLKSNGHVMVVQSESKSTEPQTSFDRILTFDIDTTTGAVVPNSCHHFVGSNMNYYPRFVFKQNNNYVIIGIANPYAANSGAENEVTDIFMLCIDENGNKIWEKTWQSTNQLERLHGAIATNDGGFLLFGNVLTLSPTSQPYFALKTNAIGEVDWYRTFYSNNIHGGMSNWSFGGIYNAVETCDAYYMMSYAPSLMFKMNKSGQFDFIKEYSSPIGHGITNMISDNQNNMTAFGLAQNGDAYLFNVNGQGNINWARQYNEQNGLLPSGTFGLNLPHCIQTDDEGYLMGFTYTNGNTLAGSKLLRSNKIGLIDCLPSASLDLTVSDKTNIWAIMAATMTAPQTNNLTGSTSNALYSGGTFDFSNECPAAITCNDLNVSIYLPKNHYFVGENIAIANSSTGHTQANWAINGQAVADPSVYNFSVGTHTIQLTATNGICTSTISRTITVSGQPTASFSYNLDHTSPKVYALYHFTPSVSDPCLEAKWDFGDGTWTYKSTSTTHQYFQSGNYNVCLTVKNALGISQQCQLLEVNCPIANPTIANTNICEGTPITLTVTNNSIGDVRWFDAPTGGNLVNSGTSYQIPNNYPAGHHSFYIERNENFEVATGYSYTQIAQSRVAQNLPSARWILNTPLSIKLKSVDIYLAQSDSAVVKIQSMAYPGKTVYTTNMVYYAGETNHTVLLDAQLDAGSYFVIIESKNLNAIIPIHYNVPNNIFTITTPQGLVEFKVESDLTTTYWGFYNPVFDFFNDCTTPRTPVQLTINELGKKLYAKAWLDGAYTTTDGLMRDDLRIQNLIPTTSPYGTSETIAPSVLSAVGSDAIVDWVKIELRLASTPASVIMERAALIQRDGDIVDLDGISAVSLDNAPNGSYYVAIRHRNHLGIMSHSTFDLNSVCSKCDWNTTQNSSLTTNGSSALKNRNNQYMLWAGDNNQNGTISYNGANNDKVSILQSVGFATPNNTHNIYSVHDLNLDGIVKYNGANNDKLIILLNVGLSTPNATIQDSIPRQ